MKAFTLLFVIVFMLASTGCASIGRTFFDNEREQVSDCNGRKDCKCRENDSTDCSIPRNQSKVYAGTRYDLAAISMPFEMIGELSKRPTGEAFAFSFVVILGFIAVPFFVVDLPFSFVSDTVLLPYTRSLEKESSLQTTNEQ